jgi:hypothetical protein
MLRHKAATAAASANMKVKVFTPDSLSRHPRNATQVASLQNTSTTQAGVGGQAAQQR